MLQNYTPQILTYYSLAFATSFLLFYVKTHKIATSIVFSMLVVFIASDYYEIPIFLRYGTTQWLHHANMIWMFILLVMVARIQASKLNISLLCLGPLLTVPILLKYQGLVYLARVIGLAILLIVTINSPGVGGKKASNTP